MQWNAITWAAIVSIGLFTLWERLQLKPLRLIGRSISAEVRLLGPLHMYHLRSGDFKICLEYAERSSEIAQGASGLHAPQEVSK
jgi:hypothetical protein